MTSTRFPCRPENRQGMLEQFSKVLTLVVQFIIQVTHSPTEDNEGGVGATLLVGRQDACPTTSARNTLPNL